MSSAILAIALSIPHYLNGVWTSISPLLKRISVVMTTKPNWLTSKQERVDTGKARLVTWFRS